MNRTLSISLLLFALWIFAFALISTHYDHQSYADQYESAEPQLMPIQRYHDTNMDGEK